MGSGSPRTTTSFRSGWWLATIASLFSLAVTATVFLWDIDGSPRQDADLAQQLSLLAGFNGFVFLATLAMGYQRVELDTGARTFRYANLETLHRWRSVRADQVERMQLWSEARRMHGLVDSVYLHHRTEANGAAPKVIRLLDGRLSPMSWTKTDAPLFVAVHDLIRQANPHADLGEALYAGQARGGR